MTRLPAIDTQTNISRPKATERFAWAHATVFRSGAELRQSGPLQSAYSQWADALVDDRPVLIALDDPIHALAAFFGILASGRICGIASQRIAASVPDGMLHILDTQLPDSDPREGAYSDALASFITFTGGTTGPPKAILRSQSSWLHSFKHQDVDIGDNVAVLGDLTHSLACYAAIEALTSWAKLYLLSDVRPDGQATAMAEHSVTVLYATPTQLKRLAGNAPCRAVRRVYVGGGAIDASTREVAATVFPNAKMQTFYGSSETSFLTIADQNTPTGSVGRAYPGVDLEIDTQQRIWANSPMLFERYLLGDSAQTKMHGGFLSVGDLGRLDTVGNLYLLGRADRSISINDQVVQLDAIEQVVVALPNVQNCAALSGSDPKRGHHLLLAIQGDPSDIAALALPKIGQILVLDTWPTLTSGKTDYSAIARRVQKDAQ